MTGKLHRLVLNNFSGQEFIVLVKVLNVESFKGEHANVWYLLLPSPKGVLGLLSSVMHASAHKHTEREKTGLFFLSLISYKRLWTFCFAADVQ